LAENTGRLTILIFHGLWEITRREPSQLSQDEYMLNIITINEKSFANELMSFLANMDLSVKWFEYMDSILATVETVSI
jgi:hypothetical protein